MKPNPWGETTLPEDGILDHFTSGPRCNGCGEANPCGLGPAHDAAVRRRDEYLVKADAYYGKQSPSFVGGELAIGDNVALKAEVSRLRAIVDKATGFECGAGRAWLSPDGLGWLGENRGQHGAA